MSFPRPGDVEVYLEQGLIYVLAHGPWSLAGVRKCFDKVDALQAEHGKQVHGVLAVFKGETLLTPEAVEIFNDRTTRRRKASINLPVASVYVDTFGADMFKRYMQLLFGHQDIPYKVFESQEEARHWLNQLWRP